MFILTDKTGTAQGDPSMKKQWTWMKAGIFVIAILFALGTVGTELAYAKGGGGGGRSFSSSRSSSSSSHKSTPAIKPTPSKSSSGFGNSKTQPAKPVVPAKPAKSTQTSLQKKQSQAASKAQSATALNAYKAEKTKFNAPTSTAQTPTSTQSAILKKTTGGSGSNARVSRSTYYIQRDRYYGGWNRPSYMYNYSSSFGMWDAMFLWMMLDTVSDNNRCDAEMYYHHQSDPGMQEWRANAEKEAANNADLKAKLATLDQKVKDMEVKGVARDESYIPAEAGVAVLASEVAEQNLPEQTAEEIKAEEKSKTHPFLWSLLILAAIGGAVVIFVLIKK